MFCQGHASWAKLEKGSKKGRRRSDLFIRAITYSNLPGSSNFHDSFTAKPAMKPFAVSRRLNSMRTLWCVAIICLCLAGCNSRDAGNLTSDVKDIAGHAGQAVGSTALAAKVNAALVMKKGVDMSGLHIEAKDGVVTVGGHVRNANEKKTVLATVKETSGVDKLVDQLRISK